MGYLTIKNQLVTILQGISSISVVYSKQPKKIDSFPAVGISAKEHESSYYSLGSAGSNERVYRHYIRVFFGTDDQNDSDYEDILEGTIDDVMSALESNITLNGTCEYAIPISGQWADGEVGGEPVRVCEIVTAATVHIAR